MKKVLFLSSDNINAKTGAAKFVRLLTSDQEFWKENEIELRVFTNSNFFSDEVKYRKTLLYKTKQTIKDLLGKTRVGRKARFINYEMNILGKRPVMESQTYLDDDALVILNDIRVAWNFYRIYSDKYKTIFIMHNCGDLLSMFGSQMKEATTSRFLKNCEKLIMNNVTELIFVSEVARKKFIVDHPKNKILTKTIYIGMDNTDRNIDENCHDIRLITVGTVGERKNQILAIRAIERLRNSNVYLTVVGGGPSLLECKEYVNKHGLSENIFFTGATNDVENILTNHNIFIMTSKDEGLPVAAQEAMAVGLPLILTDVGGCKELIEDNGILIKPELQDVVNAIDYFVRNKRLIHEYGRKSKSLYQKKFSRFIMRNEYLDTINELIDN